MTEAEIRRMEEMVVVARDLLEERPDDIWLRKGLTVMQSELDKIKNKNVSNNTKVKGNDMKTKKSKKLSEFKNWDLYLINVFLLFAYIPIYCVLSMVLPIHSDNTTFYASGILFILATTLIPIHKLMEKYLSNNHVVKNKILPNMELAHGITIITALLCFGYWMLNLTNW